MILDLQRAIYSDKSTIGRLSIDKDFFCDTLELSCRRGDEKGLLAVVPGRYRIDIVRWEKYGKDYPLLRDVPRADGKGFRTGIYIHPANYPGEIDGCIVPGIYNPNLPDSIWQSRATFARLFKRLFDDRGPWWIVIGGGGPLK